MRVSNRVAVCAAVASFAVAGFAGQRAQDQRTPKGWSYELKGGRPVPKGNRVTNADGSWREVIRQGPARRSRKRPRAANIAKPASAIPSKRGLPFRPDSVKLALGLARDGAGREPACRDVLAIAHLRAPVGSGENRPLAAVVARRRPHVEILDIRRRTRRRSPGRQVKPAS